MSPDMRTESAAKLSTPHRAEASQPDHPDSGLERQDVEGQDVEGRRAAPQIRCVRLDTMFAARVSLESPESQLSRCSQ